METRNFTVYVTKTGKISGLHNINRKILWLTLRKSEKFPG